MCRAGYPYRSLGKVKRRRVTSLGEPTQPVFAPGLKLTCPEHQRKRRLASCVSAQVFTWERLAGHWEGPLG